MRVQKNSFEGLIFSYLECYENNLNRTNTVPDTQMLSDQSHRKYSMLLVDCVVAAAVVVVVVVGNRMFDLAVVEYAMNSVGTVESQMDNVVGDENVVVDDARQLMKSLMQMNGEDSDHFVLVVYLYH